jgi:Spy/CpxP family protein refolding chaperone
MKAIRIAALGAALLIGGTLTATAQGTAQQQGGQARGGRNSQMNGIELTDAQKVKLEEIQKKYQPDMTALRAEMTNGGDRAELMKKSMALSDKQAAEIRVILTPDQQVVFDKNVAERKARMQRGRPSGN